MQSYHSKVIPVSILNAEKMAEAVLLYILRIAFQVSLFSDPTKALLEGDLGCLLDDTMVTLWEEWENLGRPLREPNSPSWRALLGSLNFDTYRGLVTYFNFQCYFKKKICFKLLR